MKNKKRSLFENLVNSHEGTAINTSLYKTGGFERVMNTSQKPRAYISSVQKKQSVELEEMEQLFLNLSIFQSGKESLSTMQNEERQCVRSELVLPLETLTVHPDKKNTDLIDTDYSLGILGALLYFYNLY